MKKILLFSICSLCFGSTFAQGSISGTITDAKTKETIIGANVVIQGTTTGGQTDVDGKFLISNIKAGSYNLQVSFITYKTHLIPNVLVEDGKRISIDVPMSEEVSTLSEVVVNGSRQTNTDYDLVRSIKEAKVIVVGITEEQISKTLDRDAAQVLKRVPGLTIKDEQFVVSRGLAERYNPVMLHNTYAPSLETDVRSFSFATIPSSQLDRILVFKSPAADLPGDFAGSVVKIFTKSIPDENGWVIDYSTQYRAGTTFQDFYHQQRNPGFITGYNTGFYNLPSDFPVNAQNVSGNNLENAGKSIKNLWKAEKGTAIPDQRLTVTYNRKFSIGNVQVGNINALNYSNSLATYNVDRGDYTDADPNYLFRDKQYNQQVRTGLLSNWAFKINSNHLIEFKNLFNVSSQDQYVNRSGATGSISEGENNGAFYKVYRGIYSSQLTGKHDLFNKFTTVEWVAGYNNTYRDQPDYKRYISKNGIIYVPNTVTPTQLGKFYSALQEDSYSGGVSVKQLIPIGGNPVQSPELKAGFFFENKTRSFHARNIGYTTATTNFDQNLAYLPIDQLLQSQNINNSTGLQIGEATNAQDSYTAQNNLLAYYAMLSLPVSSKFKLDAGVRFEDNLQQLHSYSVSKSALVDPHYWTKRVLPSANLSYNFTDKMLVRAAYGETLNRPEFREFAPFSFYDFNMNFIYTGNENLQVAKIQNFDLRWEFYPTKGEMITIGGFYKDFINPIESYVDPLNSGGGNKLVTYYNSKTAKVYGVEVEVKKSLAGLTSSTLLDKLNVMVNTTVAASTAYVPDGYLNGRSASHPLQGQAPYIINAGLYYNSEVSGWQFNLLFNTTGNTVYVVGTDHYHDVYVLPRNVVDLTFTKRLSEKFSLKGGIVDILNQPFRFHNSSTAGGSLTQVIQDYKPGQVFSIGFSARL
ncbi:MAG: TonB-dependent receptor [Bacteroidetes bacterium]|nr:TonB-dependent receptor [Bacteroidota bacterium]